MRNHHQSLAHGEALLDLLAGQNHIVEELQHLFLLLIFQFGSYQQARHHAFRKQLAALATGRPEDPLHLALMHLADLPRIAARTHKRGRSRHYTLSNEEREHGLAKRLRLAHSACLRAGLLMPET